MVGRKLTLQIFTNSKSIFDIITKNSKRTEKRLQIDTHVVRQAYELYEISDVGFVRSENNPAGAFTKIGHNSALAIILNYNRCDFDVERWVYRAAKDEKRKSECQE